MESHHIQRAARALVLLIAMTCHPQHLIYAEERSVLVITEEELEMCASDSRCLELLLRYAERHSLEMLPGVEDLEPPVSILDLHALFDKLAKLKRVCLHLCCCKCGVTLYWTWDNIIYEWLKGLGLRTIPSALDLRDPDEKEIDKFLTELREVLRGKTNQELIELLEKLKKHHPSLSEEIDGLIELLRQRGVKLNIQHDLIDQFLEELRQLIFDTDTKTVVSALPNIGDYCIASAEQFMTLH